MGVKAKVETPEYTFNSIFVFYANDQIVFYEKIPNWPKLFFLTGGIVFLGLVRGSAAMALYKPFDIGSFLAFCIIAILCFIIVSIKWLIKYKRIKGAREKFRINVSDISTVNLIEEDLWSSKFQLTLNNGKKYKLAFTEKIEGSLKSVLMDKVQDNE